MPIFKKCCFIRKAWVCPCILGLEFRAEYSPGISWTRPEKVFSGLVFFWYRLKESEEKSRKWESRSEDTHLISSLQDKLSEREEIIKQLAVRFPFLCTYIYFGICWKALFSVSHIVLDWYFLFWNTLTNFKQIGVHTRNFISFQEGRKFQQSLVANTESYRNRSFSFNPGTRCLTPSMKVKWAMQLKLQIMMFYSYLNHTDDQDNKGPISFYDDVIQ